MLTAGLLTLLQDAGRTGYRHLGVGAAGALDLYSHAVANLLVGNGVDAPTLEITLAGPRLHFDRPARIALCGAEIDARADGVAIPGWRPVDLPAGSELRLGRCRRGARSYLAVAGSFAAARVLGSASTDLRGGFGGIRGRMLKAGDVLSIAGASPPTVAAIRVARWWIDPSPDLDFASPATIRVVPGHDALSPPSALFAREWRVAAASDRQGLRLDGDTLTCGSAHERLLLEKVSEPVAPGTIQLPPDGHPIVLLADAQTHGGYPRIGHAIVADRPRLAQLRPGDALRFVPCTPEHAHRLRCEQRQRLARIALAIESRRLHAE